MSAGVWRISRGVWALALGLFYAVGCSSEELPPSTDPGSAGRGGANGGGAGGNPSSGGAATSGGTAGSAGTIGAGGSPIRIDAGLASRDGGGATSDASICGLIRYQLTTSPATGDTGDDPCAFLLPAIPPDPNNLSVYANSPSGAIIPEDVSDGWMLGAEEDRTLKIELTGSYCSEVNAGIITSLVVYYGCPSGGPIP